jgi:hypothetical protein
MFLALALLACGDKDDNALVPASPSSSDDGTGDGGGDEIDSDLYGLCGPYAGVEKVGSAWEYRYDGERDGSYTVEATSWDGDSGALILETSSDYFQDGVHIVSATAGEYLCDDEGMWALSLYTEYTEEASGMVEEGWSRLTFDAPALVLPFTLVDGTSWSTIGEGTAEYSSGVSDTVNLLTESVVEGEEAVSVPAGSYDALRIGSVSYDGVTETTSATSWRSPGVGVIKDAVSELVRYDP